MKKISLTSLLLALIVLPTFAYSQETVSLTPYYQHPVLAIIEDSGNNIGIGQSMAENLLYPQGLVEEVDGKLYLALRYNLADNIGKVNFSLQKKGEEDFIAVDSETIATAKDSVDYRIRIPAKDIIIRSQVYVKPMERDVIFYIGLSDFVQGNSDFKALGEKGVSQLQKTYQDGDKVETHAVDSSIRLDQLGYQHGLLLKGAPELQEFYQLNGIETESQPQSQAQQVAQAPSKPVRGDELMAGFSLVIVNALVLALVLVSTCLLLTALFLYYASKAVKELNQVREAALYEED